ncbi:MAG: ketol-acid reductoisomerase [Deltaproteobacteria bacterium]|nr:ketol-acid reductoisomerase [Deltaproteobacteria bacterium]
MTQAITIFGFGNQGAAQAENLRDQGWHVRIAVRAGGPSATRAAAADFSVATDLALAARETRIAALLLPDTAQPELWRTVLQPHLPQAACLVFAHGYNLHYGTIAPRPDLDVLLAAPLGSGMTVRRNFRAGAPLSIATAVHQDATGRGAALLDAYVAGITTDARWRIATTVREETETDLFSEQTLSCGGLQQLIRLAFETLVAAGYDRRLAYFTCAQEIQDLAQLFAANGLAGAFTKISPTARYGALTRGPRTVGEPTRAAMEQALAEIRDGRFAKELTEEANRHFATTKRLLAPLEEHELARCHLAEHQR